MKILLAGPGTGKTTGIKELIEELYGAAERILVLSFTNATVDDLRDSFSEYDQLECSTLHSYAMQINPETNLYITDGKIENDILKAYAKSLDLEFDFLCDQLGCITFDRMISKCADFLEANPVYGQSQIGMLDLLIVDEYQDFNEGEQKLVGLISGFSEETIILGDDDQSIYGFKDADPDGIIQIYQSEDTERLEHENKCYRCPDVIVRSAGNLISHNKNRIAKEWHPTNKEGVFFPHQVKTQEAAIEFIADQIAEIKEDDDEASFLILSPMRWYVKELMSHLDDADVPYTDFWTQPISDDDYRRIWIIRASISRRKLLNLLFLGGTLTQYFKAKFKRTLKEAFLEGYEESELLAKVLPMFSDKVTQFIASEGTLNKIRLSKPEWNHLTDLIDTDNLEASLDELIKNVKPEVSFDDQGVNLMSIHKSEGLQADVVFVTGLVNGVLPSNKNGQESIEAQRRLLFVAMTRAKQVLFLLSPIEWRGDIVNAVDKNQFKYDPYSKKWKATASSFIAEMK